LYLTHAQTVVENNEQIGAHPHMVCQYFWITVDHKQDFYISKFYLF